MPTIFALQAAIPDTVAMVPVRDALRTAEVISIIFLALVVLGVLLVFLAFTLKLQNLESDVRRLLKRVDGRLDPVMDRAKSVAENVDYVSHVVRTDVEELAETVDRIRRRLDDTSERMEERVEEFNALMEVVQSEAEDIFLDTASTVRGVRAGSRELRNRRAPKVAEDEEESAGS